MDATTIIRTELNLSNINKVKSMKSVKKKVLSHIERNQEEVVDFAIGF